MSSTGNATGGAGPTAGATTGAGVSGTGGRDELGRRRRDRRPGGGTTGGTGGALNQPCSVDNNMDTCVAAGLVCEYSTDPAHTGTVCELPGEFQPCQVAVGCNDPSLQCLSFSTGSYCFITCESSSDCTTLYTTCQGGPPSICYVAYCDVGEGVDGGFASCDSAGLGDGTCVPDTGAGVCLQGGTAALGAVCDAQRGSGVSSADLCAPTSTCIPGGTSGAGHCAPLCGIDGGPSCPAPNLLPTLPGRRLGLLPLMPTGAARTARSRWRGRWGTLARMRVLLPSLAFLLVACSSSATVPDSGHDGGTFNDGGTDAGPNDMEDAGPMDAGPYCPSGYTFLPDLTATATTHKFSAAAQEIDPQTQYAAVVETDVGRMVWTLNSTVAPIATNSLVFLALNHYFDGIAFHRVIDGFVAQGGDPNTLSSNRSSWGMGGPGYTFVNEVSPSLNFTSAGILAMANTGQPDPNGSQFFITFAPQTSLRISSTPSLATSPRARRSCR